MRSRPGTRLAANWPLRPVKTALTQSSMTRIHGTIGRRIIEAPTISLWSPFMGRLLFAALLAVACSSAIVACGGSAKEAAPATVESKQQSTSTTPEAKPTVAAQPSATVAATNTTAAAPSAVPSPVATTAAASSPAAATATAPPAPQATAVPPTAAPTSAPPPPQASNAAVTLLDTFVFSPASVTIGVGGSVTWTWQGGTFHDVGSSVFASDPAGIKNSGTYRVTFSTAGTFSYFCSIHVGMTGVVVVR